MDTILSIDSIRYPLTGIGRYTLELATNLSLQQDVRVQYLWGRRIVNHLPDPSAWTSPEFPLSATLRQKAIRSPLVVDVAQAMSALRVRRVLRPFGDHVFHGPNYYLPEFEGASVATIHDLSIFSQQESHPPERVRYMRKEVSKTLRRATALITDSEFTRHEVAQFFGWPLKRIHAIPLAASSSFHPRGCVETQHILRKYELRHGHYCLYSGTIEPRKNIETLVNAYLRLPTSIKDRWPLVLVGYRGWQSDAIHERIAESGRKGQIRYLGYLPEEHLPYVFAGARVFAYPSLYEGFGLPALEAISSGIPLICSTAASLPEVVGDAACFRAPQDVEGWSESLRQAIEDETWRAAASARGLVRSRQFSWTKCAEQTIDVYRRVSFQ